MTVHQCCQRWLLWRLHASAKYWCYPGCWRPIPCVSI